ncbi:DUF4442 domain-containing protein [Pedobacter sp. HMF7647]|uniref:DUF4442 domain-containing protein n=1 Tax=Hufsiella arboris TaxID=2695275 RepID=A0A7K1Y8C3_9SPHI|nr:DUF4442 domain-containing protein [Hufsiella arboris]MXV50670.1 DUF4442 domain-containing protein [Hufsiella arboris]
MKVSENTLKWAMRFYPPLFFQRIWVRKFGQGFKSADVKISKSIFNTNYNNSIFGGTIYAATDPFFSLLFDQVLQRRGYKVRVWLKSGQISYLKPGRTNMYFNIVLTEENIDEACQVLDTVGKFVKTFPMEIFNKEGELCATVQNEVYIRNLYKGENQVVAY